MDATNLEEPMVQLRKVVALQKALAQVGDSSNVTVFVMDDDEEPIADIYVGSAEYAAFLLEALELQGWTLEKQALRDEIGRPAPPNILEYTGF